MLHGEKKGERETERKERQRNREAENGDGERDREIKKRMLKKLKPKTHNHPFFPFVITNGQKKRFSLPMKKKKQKPIEIFPWFAIKNEKKALTFLSDFFI